MRYTFIQHIPGFIDSRGLSRVQFEFDTLDQLVINSFIRKWETRGYKISWEDDLIVARGEKDKWVIGYVKDNKEILNDFLGDRGAGPGF